MKQYPNDDEELFRHYLIILITNKYTSNINLYHVQKHFTCYKTLQ